MLKRIHIGNLPFLTPEEEIRKLLGQFGTVQTCELVTNKKRRPRTIKSRGFAFIEMEEDEANAAIAGIDGFEFEGRTLTAGEAKAKKPEPVFDPRARDNRERERGRYRRY